MHSIYSKINVNGIQIEEDYVVREKCVYSRRKNEIEIGKMKRFSFNSFDFRPN